jgi:glycosyltransferase involved in cell wall biosynthesis
MTSSSSPAVSIVIRTRNRPALLGTALADISRQTFTDTEILVVNDGGDPGPVAAAVTGQPGQLKDRTRIINRTSRPGRWLSANAGAQAARGRYLNLHDDDSWNSAFLDRTVAWLDAHSTEDAVAAPTDIIWEHFSPAGELEHSEREPFNQDLREITLYDLLQTNRSVPIGVLYRRAVLEELSWFDGSLPVVRDWEYHIRLARRRPIRVLDGDALAFWHQRIGVHGDRGNSVIAMHDDHRRTDKLVRDRALRAYAAKEGIGPLLYAARMFDDKAGALHVHLEGVEQRIARSSPGSAHWTTGSVR